MAFLTGDDGADLDDVDWLLPEWYAHRDKFLHLTGPVIVESDFIIDGPHGPDGFDVVSNRF